MKHVFAALVAGMLAAGAHAQVWSPQKNVEIVVGSAAGGSNDHVARTLERIIAAHKLVPATISVANRPGAGGSIANTYVSQRVGDPHVC